jgi:hypothetical protein
MVGNGPEGGAVVGGAVLAGVVEVVGGLVVVVVGALVVVVVDGLGGLTGGLVVVVEPGAVVVVAGAAAGAPGSAAGPGAAAGAPGSAAGSGAAAPTGGGTAGAPGGGTRAVGGGGTVVVDVVVVDGAGNVVDVVEVDVVEVDVVEVDVVVESGGGGTAPWRSAGREAEASAPPADASAAPVRVPTDSGTTMMVVSRRLRWDKETSPKGEAERPWSQDGRTVRTEGLGTLPRTKRAQRRREAPPSASSTKPRPCRGS